MQHVTSVAHAYRRGMGAARCNGRAFVAFAAAFLVAAGVIAVIHASCPMAHGWWLVAYLSLVGGVSQSLLGPGLIALVGHGDARTSDLGTMRAELLLGTSHFAA